MSPTALLGATYRVQLSRDFNLGAARSIVDYLDRLGISHLYSSPMLEARAASTHGYDVVNPTRLNPELGTDDSRRGLVSELRAHGMGIILDIVPNHMGTGSQNPYWMDVLMHGRSSRYAEWFDIDWDRPGRFRGRVLVPVLGSSLEAAIASGELRLVMETETASIRYHDHRFPLEIKTAPKPGDPDRFGDDEHGRENLVALLDQQYYALIDWRRAQTDINYRRFFDINDLIAVRVDDPDVFDAIHALVLDWIGDGTVDGLRVDHIDGLLDPLAYLERLRTAVQSRQADTHVPIFVEKILSPPERLRTEWPVDGTTGYEFTNDVESIFIDALGFKLIEDHYRSSIARARKRTFDDAAIHAKLEVLRTTLSPDVKRLARLFMRDESRYRTRGVRGTVGMTSVRRTLSRIIAMLPVYRTYITATDEVAAEDRRLIDQSVASVSRRWPESAECADRVRNAMLPVADAPAGEFTLRFQQTSGPAAAKGVEDTALYRYVPLVSLNEVGGAPDRALDTAVDVLHRANSERARIWPRSILATSTHDTKHSADVRSRLDVLSEIPEEWNALVARWRRMNRTHRTVVAGRTAPDANTEYLLYQTLVGIWEPAKDDTSHALVADRVDAYMRKAAREAGTRTSWMEPDLNFEEALTAFVRALVTNHSRSHFRAELDKLIVRIGPAGCWNALSRTLVHLTAPGTPDLYQGDELWNYALVDPDNRRPVDYERRRRLLGEIIDRASAPRARAVLCDEMTANPYDDRLKLHVIHSALHARRADPELFASGYNALEVTGTYANHVFAFARVHEGRMAITVVPRLAMTLSNGDPPIGREVWKDTAICIPPAIAQDATYRNVLTGATLRINRSVDLAQALDRFPVGLLVTDPKTGRANGQAPRSAALLPT